MCQTLYRVMSQKKVITHVLGIVATKNEGYLEFYRQGDPQSIYKQEYFIQYGKFCKVENSPCFNHLKFLFYSGAKAILEAKPCF